ncbi:MAG TPA: hypothetical protein VD863_10395, partial [Bradyrhizobium sp.]|nr:hypothetical protein [Bradyrhizobium sp.]
SSARRSVYSTSGVSETWMDATAMFKNLFALSTSLRGALATKQSNLSYRREMDCFAALAMTLIVHTAH